jgi:hypothetical protein
MNAPQRKQSDRVLGALKLIDVGEFTRAAEEPIAFNTAAWNRYLMQADRKPLASILRSVPHITQRETITRGDVIALGADATTKAQREALLVGTLVWGKGPLNNRMFPAFVRLLNDPNLDAALVASATHARAGRPADAYRSWRSSGVKGLGEAFFTKWLWAASHIGGHEFTAERPRCLVLDIRVWNSLGHKDHQWSSVIAAGTKRRPERYAAYTRACALWADELGLTAEQVEWALFRANGSIKAMTSRKA